MKKLFLVLLLLPCLVTAQTKEEKRIKDKMINVNLSVKTYMTNKNREEFVLFCDVTSTRFYLDKSRVIVVNDAVKLDLTVKKRNIGKYNSWLTVSKEGDYYFITPIGSTVEVGSDGEGRYGLFFQPVDEQLNFIYSSAIIIVATMELCK